MIALTRDLTDKPNRNRNRIESKSDKQSKGDINMSVVVIGNICYGDWEVIEFDCISLPFRLRIVPGTILAFYCSYTNKVSCINSKEILMSPLDSSPDSDSIRFWFRLGLSVRSLPIIPLLGMAGRRDKAHNNGYPDWFVEAVLFFFFFFFFTRC